MGKGSGSVPAAPYASAPQVQNSSQTQTLFGGQTASGSSNSNTTGTGNSVGATDNTYSAQQQGLQGQAADAASNYLQTGNLPGTFGAPPQVFDAYNTYYQQYVAPQIAASGGAGSPALASNLALGLQQLASTTYQNQSNNFASALAGAAGIGYTPTGTTNEQAQSGNQQSTGSWQSNQASNATSVSDLHSVLASLKV